MAAVRYVPIDGECVSVPWFAVLAAMRSDGVAFNVNEGHRTKERQGQLVAQLGLWSPSNPTGAAAVSDNAPHIRTGRLDHAIDFGNDPAAFAWLASHSLQPARTVPLGKEPWHIECPASALVDYAAKHSNRQLRFLGPRQRVAASRLLAARRRREAERATGKGPLFHAADREVQEWRRRVEAQFRRAHGRQARVLRLVLADRNGWLG